MANRYSGSKNPFRNIHGPVPDWYYDALEKEAARQGELERRNSLLQVWLIAGFCATLMLSLPVFGLLGVLPR